MNFDELVKTGEAEAPPKRGTDRRRGAEVVIGGLPTVSLMPREFLTKARERTIRHALVGVVVLSVVVAGGATALAATVTSLAQDRLTAATAQSQTLNAELSKFADVQRLQQGVQLGKAAVTVGSSPSIDWQGQIQAIEADMPSGYVVTTVTGDSADAVSDYPQGTTPLEMPRAATIVMNVTSQSVAELPIWLRKIRSIPAYADATASFGYDTQSGYSIQVTMHLSAKALVDAQKGTTK